MNKKLLFVLIFVLILIIGGITQFFVMQHIETKNDTVKERVGSFFQRSKDVFAQKDTHVVAIGDSLTQGVGDATNSGGYVGILDDVVNDDIQTATFDNFGHAGDRTDQLLKRMK